MEARIWEARTLLMLLGLCQLLLLSVHVPGCTACSVPEGWQPQPIEARVGDDSVQFAVLGNVTATTDPRFVRRFGGNVYGAQVAVECVYKRPPQQSVFESLSVIGFGESNDCTATEVEPGRRYVFLMAPYQAGFAVVEANVQAAAEPATPQAEQALQDAFGCDPPSEPTTLPPTTTTAPTTLPPTTEPPTTPAPPPTTAAAQEPQAGDDEKGAGGTGGAARATPMGVLAALALVWSRALFS